MQIPLDGSKFTHTDGYTHLAVKVDLPGGANDIDSVQNNNYHIQPITILAQSKYIYIYLLYLSTTY